MSRSVHTRYLAHMAAGFALAAVCLPGYIELFPENVFSGEYAVWSAQFGYASEAAQPEPDVLVLGDSRVHAAAVPARIGERVRSLAVGGATPIELYFLLRRYLTHHPAPRAIVVSLAPPHYEQSPNFWERTAKFKALQRGEAFEVFRRAESLGDATLGSADFGELARRWLGHRLNLPFVYAPELRNSQLVRRRTRNLERRRAIDANAGHSFYGEAEASSGPNTETGAVGFEASELLDAYLRDLLALAREREIEVVVAAMPVNRSSLEKLRPRFVTAHRAYFAALAADHPVVRFHADLWSLPDDHFGDISHVNARGAEVVSAWLASVLEGEGSSPRSERLADPRSRTR